MLTIKIVFVNAKILIMATISMSLSSKFDISGKSEIYFRFSGGRSITNRFKTGVFIERKRWNDKEKCIIIPRIKSPENDEVKFVAKKITELSTYLISEFEQQLTIDSGVIGKSWFNEKVDKFHNPQKYEKKNPMSDFTLLSFIDYFIKNEAENRRHKATGRRLSIDMLQQFKATQKNLQLFFNDYHLNDLKFNQINQDFYKDYVEFMQSKEYYLNSVGKHIRVLKTLLNCAPEELKSLSSHDKFHVFTEDTDNVYLSIQEIEMLWDFDFSKTPYLDKVVDLFIVMCWTGCRYSDLSKVIDVKKGDKFIAYTQQKTNQKVVIPIHKMVRNVFEKYDYNMPVVITNQKFNDYIKEATKLAGLNEEIEISRTIGGKLSKIKLKKHELISSHTGRRSFCTNSYIQNIPNIYIMIASGHKTEKSFHKYIKMNQQEKAERMAEIWAKLSESDDAKQNYNDDYISNLLKKIEDLENKNKTLSSIKSALIKINSDLKEQLNTLSRFSQL